MGMICPKADICTIDCNHKNKHEFSVICVLSHCLLEDPLKPCLLGGIEHSLSCKECQTSKEKQKKGKNETQR